MNGAELIRFNSEGCFLPDHGITHEDMASLAPRLEAVRREILEADLSLLKGDGDVPPEKQPLDAGFLEMPERLLREYRRDTDGSTIGRILQTARQLRDRVDRVVVLGIGGSYMGARALMDACCEPYFNSRSRAARGGFPRLYFEGNNLDNDASQGLLQLLRSESAEARDELMRNWAIVVISKSGGTIETAVAFRQFLRELRQTVRSRDQLAELVIPVTGTSGKLASLADRLGCRQRFEVPEGVGGRFSVFSAVGLLPAALIGIDIIALLQSAALMNEHFRTAPPGANVVLDYVAVNHLMDQRRGASIRVLSIWNKSLEATGWWYDQLLAESLGKEGLGATPLTVVNTRDLHSRAQQHQQGRRDKIFNNLVVDHWHYDPLPVGRQDEDEDGLNQLAERTMPQLLDAALAGTNAAYREGGRPTTEIRLPAASERGLGQLLQMLMLATVVEGRLLEINPYGQPGVEDYKRHMTRILEKGGS